MECGFYHPTIGYWQTTNKPPKEILASYPSGTLQIPLKPGTGYRWDGKQWLSPVEVPPAREEVVSDIEARRKAALDAGVEFEGVRYHSDSGFLLELMTMINSFKIGAITGMQPIRAKTGEMMLLTESQIAGLASAIGVYRQSVYAASWAEKDAIPAQG